VITASGLNVVMRFITDGKESMHSYVADGKERVVTDVRVGKTTEKAYWKKSSFITETIGRITSSEVPPVSDEIFRAKDCRIYRAAVRKRLGTENDAHSRRLEANFPTLLCRHGNVQTAVYGFPSVFPFELVPEGEGPVPRKGLQASVRAISG
jgi:hypothetical protein